jgi:hypothetical protein
MENRIRNRLASILRIATVLLVFSLACTASAYQSPADCDRAQPRPILQVSKSLPQSTFTLKSATEGTEVWQIDSKTSIEISQSGCEQAIERYTFVVLGDIHEVSDLKYWLARGAQLLSGLPVVEYKKKQIDHLAEVLNHAGLKAHEPSQQFKTQISGNETLQVNIRTHDSAKEIAIKYVVDL